MLFPKSHLTFGEIADLWAAEIAVTPPAEGRDEILARIEVGLRKHEFDHAELMIWRSARDVLMDDENWVRQDAGWVSVSYEMLENTLFHKPDEYNRKVWLEGLRISKEDFGCWCDERGSSRPRFWFEKEDGISTAATETEAGGQPPSEAETPKATITKPRPKRGRREKYDWQSFDAQVVAIAHYDGLPDTQAELEKKMLQWCEDTWGHQPGISTVRDRLGPLYRRLLEEHYISET